MKPIDVAVESAGSQAELARLLTVLPQHVYNWQKRGVPPERCIDIEIAVGGAVTRYDLRPDVFGPAPTERAA